jgi:hypothetical protein
MIWFFRSAGILMVRVVTPVASLGGRPFRFIGRPRSLVPYKSG